MISTATGSKSDRDTSALPSTKSPLEALSATVSAIDVPPCDAAVDDLERRTSELDRSGDGPEGGGEVVDVGPEREGDFGLDPGLEQPIVCNGLGLCDQHVVQQRTEVGLVDLELCLHGR
ncbi:hypothetical protein NOS52_30555 [Rhodococcus qingshengii]|nr:hypothetical protein [Rhodococcus qingshengii]MCQ4152125.1 hypothetical protein [Rhodococcus qingshengii]MDJ0441251.1 hypothetical protein [Rhodococcus qingshengii]